jgi:hypothetical protein
MIGAMPCWGKSPAWLPIYDQASSKYTLLLLRFKTMKVAGSQAVAI